MRLLLEYRCFMKKASLFALTIVFLLWPLVLAAQTELLPMDHQLNARLARSLYSTNRPVHSSIQPYEFGAIAGGNNVDSLLSTGRVWDTTETTWLTRRIFGEHLAAIAEDDYHLYADFYPDFQFVLVKNNQVGKQFVVSPILNHFMNPGAET